MEILVSVSDLGHRVPVCGFHTRPCFFALCVLGSRYILLNLYVLKRNIYYMAIFANRCLCKMEKKMLYKECIYTHTPSSSFVETDHEIFSTVILYLLLIQEGRLSVSGERMCTSTGQPLRGLSLPRKKCS